MLTFNKSGTITQASGIAKSRESDGETIASVEGMSVGDFSPSEQDGEKERERFNNLLLKGGQTAFIHEDERGECWSVRFMRVPAETVAISLSSKLPGKPANLTERELRVLQMMVDDIPTSEQREELQISVNSYNAMTKKMREKIGCKTNFGMVRYAFLMGLARE